jgi:hypothetical protein
MNTNRIQKCFYMNDIPAIDFITIVIPNPLSEARVFTTGPIRARFWREWAAAREVG